MKELVIRCVSDDGNDGKSNITIKRENMTPIEALGFLDLCKIQVYQSIKTNNYFKVDK